MQNEQLQVGNIVEAVYNSGHYVGEIVGFSERTPRVKVRVLAVLKHPEQGDLHYPGEVDVPIFHERRALAEREIALIPRRRIKLWEREKEIPSYQESLRDALFQQMKQLEANVSDDFAKASYEHLKRLKQEYGFED